VSAVVIRVSEQRDDGCLLVLTCSSCISAYWPGSVAELEAAAYVCSVCGEVLLVALERAS
jgi:hypothetical protein